MKYWVNQETKEHYRQPGMMVPSGPVYDIVYADDDGWIPWDGGECPLPDGTDYEILCYRKNDVRCLNKAPRGCWEYISYSRDGCIKAYRPIFPADSKELFDETWKGLYASRKVYAFTLLSEAVAASAEIPALIAEINAMLPEGYEVTRK
jgi:hypothetical protein